MFNFFLALNKKIYFQRFLSLFSTRNVLDRDESESLIMDSPDFQKTQKKIEYNSREIQQNDAKMPYKIHAIFKSSTP